jgi:hypothetical protein
MSEREGSSETSAVDEEEVGTVSGQANFTVHLEVLLVGPDDEWDAVARALATRIDGMRLRGGYVVAHAEIDSAEEAME